MSYWPGPVCGLYRQSGAAHVTDLMFSAAAQALAAQVSDDDLRVGRIFPPQTKMREVAIAVATAVAQVAYESGIAGNSSRQDPRSVVVRSMYEPGYHQ